MPDVKTTAALPQPVTLAHRRRDAAGDKTEPLHTKEERMPADRQRRTPPPERSVFGLTILSSSHPEVRRLQQAAVQPTLHGHKVWPTSLVLLDYLHQRGLPPQTRVLELGCGWGLVGIACAKTFQAQVTALDADAAVFPYLQLHAARNGVSPSARAPLRRSRPRTSRRSI
jgi:predicted nicotinamide N-methyase